MPHADLPAIWDGFKAQVEEFQLVTTTLVVTDASQTDKMKLARTTRLSLKNICVAIEKKRKELTENALRTKQQIDKCAAWL